MRDAVLTAGGAALVAVLNEVRATLRARQAARDREQLAALARCRLAVQEAREDEDQSP